MINQPILFIRIVTTFLLLVFFSAFFNVVHARNKLPHNRIFQVATIGSLARGVYDGDYNYGELFSKGDQGLGTFEGIDGEMVAVDGVYYQIDAAGNLRKVEKKEVVPFAEVVDFKAEQLHELNQISSYEQLMSLLSGYFANKNVPYAIRIDGQFKKLHLRSLRKQTKPYPPLAEAAKSQAIFDLENINGTIVGFWFPSYWAGIAVPGYHLHFVSADRDIGGHVLGMNVDHGRAAIAAVYDFSIHMPSIPSFARANLDPQALHDDIKSAEGGVK